LQALRCIKHPQIAAKVHIKSQQTLTLMLFIIDMNIALIITNGDRTIKKGVKYHAFFVAYKISIQV
jgi:hypothetical protein